MIVAPVRRTMPVQACFSAVMVLRVSLKAKVSMVPEAQAPVVKAPVRVKSGSKVMVRVLVRDCCRVKARPKVELSPALRRERVAGFWMGAFGLARGEGGRRVF